MSVLPTLPQARVLKSNEHCRGLFKPFVQHVALRRHGVVDELRLGLRQLAIGMAGEIHAAIPAGRVHVDVPVGERARDDAVVVAGIALCGHHAHAAARRAALVIGVVERLRVVDVDEPLRLHRHVVQRAVREVDDLLGMTEREHAGGAVGRRVTRVGTGRRIAAAQRHLHVAPALDRAGPTAVADREELAIPVLRRQPELDVDVRVGRRLEHHRDLAVLGYRLRRRCVRRWRWAAARRRSEDAFGYRRRGRDGRALELNARELLARHVETGG